MDEHRLSISQMMLVLLFSLPASFDLCAISSLLSASEFLADADDRFSQSLTSTC